MKGYNQISIMNNILKLKLSSSEKILFFIFKRYTYKIFEEGIKYGYSWKK